MDMHINTLANFITHKVYPGRDPRRDGMKLAVNRLLNILVLNTGIVAATFCISTSISPISIGLSGASCFLIYRLVRKIYIDVRADTGTSAAVAEQEFDEISKAIREIGWKYCTMGFRHFI